MAKSTKITAHYQGHPRGSEQCQVCTMFVPQTDCRAVEGPVNRNGWCRYYAGIGAALTAAAKSHRKR